MSDQDEFPTSRIMLISTHGYVAADPPLGAPDTGGQVVYILELARKLGQFGYAVDIWTRQFEDQPAEETLTDGVRIIRVPCGGKKFIAKEYLHKKLPEWNKNVLSYIKAHGLKYQFITSHYWDAGLAGQALSDELDIPHLHTPHSIGTWKEQKMKRDFPDDADTFEERYNFSERIKCERSIYHSCDLVIATTPIQMDMIIQDYELEKRKIQMIPPGYDDNRFFPMGESSRQTARARLNFAGPTVFAVSRLAYNKGLDLLIRSFGCLSRRMDDARLVLAIGHENRNEGEEEIFQELLTTAREEGVEKRITFTGFIPDEDLPDYYRSADLFVLSSRYEPFGMTAVEAMASGTPAVITTHGGLSRVLDYGIHALMADPLDPQELGIALYQVLRYPQLKKRLSERGARRARSRFTWTGIAQQMLQALEDHTDVSLESPRR